MNSPVFLAIVHGPAEAEAAAAIADAAAPASVTRIDLAAGSLLLCRWDGAPVPRLGALVTLDGTGGAPAVPVPRSLIDASPAPAGLLDVARQRTSYLWLDEDRRLTCWTDHLGQARLYHARRANCVLLSDDPALLADARPALEPAMVASFLVNGHMLRERTLFAGVASLPPASAGPITPDGPRTTPYWRFQPGADVRRNEADTGEELWSRLTRSVLAHVDGRHAVLPLSGGYDSSTLLGILHGAGRPVSTFSYVAGEPRPGCDAEVARRQARSLGIEHRIYRFDQDFDIVGMIDAHVDNGLIQRKACYEVNVYDRVCRDAAARWIDPVVCFGDEAFGQGSYRTDGGDNLLGSVGLKSPRLLAQLEPALPRRTAQALRDGLEDAYRELIAATSVGPDRDDARDTLFFEMYLQANMVPLRRFTVGRSLPVAQPYLELAVLDMARHVPSRQRSDKGFFEAEARRRLPDLYRIRRSRTGQAKPNLHKMFARQAGTVGESIDRFTIGIPGILTATDLRVAFGQVLAAKATPPTPMQVLTGATWFVSRRGLAPARLISSMRRRALAPFGQGADAAGLLMRALHLAMTCERLVVRAPPTSLAG